MSKWKKVWYICLFLLFHMVKLMAYGPYEKIQLLLDQNYLQRYGARGTINRGFNSFVPLFVMKL